VVLTIHFLQINMDIIHKWTVGSTASESQVCRLKLSTGTETIAYIPGEGHSLQASSDHHGMGWKWYVNANVMLCFLE
jgi:hypothetical protein